MRRQSNNEWTWYCVEQPAGSRDPQWMRSVAVDPNGELYFPAGALGDEQAIMLCAAHDGEPWAVSGKHLYLRAAWLRREYPDAIPTLDTIERRVGAASSAMSPESAAA